MGCPGGVPGTNSGRPRDTWDIWAWFMCKSILKGQNVPGTDGTYHGTDGTYHGTDGTCPRDRRDAHQGVSRQNSLCLLVFFPHFLLAEKIAVRWQGSIAGNVQHGASRKSRSFLDARQCVGGGGNRGRNCRHSREFGASAACTGGRVQMGSDRLDRCFTRFYLLGPVRVHPVPRKHMIYRDFWPDFHGTFRAFLNL